MQSVVHTPRYRTPAAILLLLLLTSCTIDTPKPEVGSTAPPFTLKTLDGVEYALDGQRGKVVLLNIWATWCPPCRQEMPSMVRFYDMLRRQGVEILAVSEDRDLDALRDFIRRYQVNFPVLVDEDKRVYNLYRATGVPETHLIDKKGTIRKIQIGPFDWTHPDVLRMVGDLLAE
jgi:peroxiredoxin